LGRNKDPSLNTQIANSIRPYAGWAAAALLAVAIFSGLIASTFALPMLLLFLAGALATFRYWDALNTFDVWALDEWIRTRGEAIGIFDWYSPHQAAELFCSPVVVKARNEAAAEMNAVMMDLVRNPGRSAHADADFSMHDHPAGADNDQRRQTSQHDAAQIRYSQCNAALSRELLALLQRGDLLAKGLLTQDDVARAERLIPTSRWRVMNLDIARGDASGHGWNYTGIIVGKKPIAARAPAPREPAPKAPAPRRRR
jgi:hypothetical protein